MTEQPTEQECAIQGDKLLGLEIKKRRSRPMTKWEAEVLAHEYDETFLVNRIKQADKPDFDLGAYVQCNRHRMKCPAWLKPRYLDVLMRYVPGPLGLGMDQTQTGKDIGISRRQVYRILAAMKKDFPEAMVKVESMRKVMTRQGGNMRTNKRSFEGLLSCICSFQNSSLREEEGPFKDPSYTVEMMDNFLEEMSL